MCKWNFKIFMNQALFVKISLAVFVLMFLGQCIFLNMPFIGADGWRNAQTYGVARNFVEENFDILKPRYDLRENLADGYYPGEFPLQSAISAIFMKVFGETVFIPRLLNLLITLLGAFLCFQIASSLFPTLPNAGFIAALLFSTHSLVGILSVAIMPEMFCSTISLFAFYYFLKSNNYYVRLMVVALLLTVSTLIKPTGYLVVVPMILLAKKYQKQTIAELFIYATLPFIFLKLWIVHTMQFEHYVYGTDYSLTHHWARTIHQVVKEFDFDLIKRTTFNLLVYGANIGGIFSILWILFRIKNVSLSREFFLRHKVIFALLGWAGTHVLFMLYAGRIQSYQTYYSFPISIPFLFISSYILSHIKLHYLLIIIALQFSNKYVHLQLNYIKYINHWDEVRLEKFTNTFSSRNDLFLIFNDNYYDFELAGRLGRRGINVIKYSDILKKRAGFDYLYIKQKYLNDSINLVTSTKIKYQIGENVFYKLNE